MLKLTLPEQDDFYADCIRHPNVWRVVALSGSYAREESERPPAQESRYRGELNGVMLNAGDGAAISQEEILEFKAVEDAEMVLFDLT